MPGILLSFWEGLFSGDMLVLGRVNLNFPTKHVIPESLKFSHWLSENIEVKMGYSEPKEKSDHHGMLCKFILVIVYMIKYLISSNFQKSEKEIWLNILHETLSRTRFYASGTGTSRGVCQSVDTSIMSFPNIWETRSSTSLKGPNL